MSDELAERSPNIALALINGTTAVPKAVAKLFDTVGDQLGLFLAPIHGKRETKARVDSAIIEAKAEHEIAVLKMENRLALRDLKDRAAERTRAREERRQRNLEDITSKAATVLESKEAIADDPVEDDWIHQFVDACQDVGDEQMQSLWAKVLAGEVEKPGRYSARTIDFIRKLGRHEADLFTRCCSMLWRFIRPDGEPHLYVPDLGSVEHMAGVSLTYADMLILRDIGLVGLSEFGRAALTFRFTQGSQVSTALQGFIVDAYQLDKHYRLSLEMRDSSSPIEIQLGYLTRTGIGKELAPISGAEPNEAYREWALVKLREAGWRVQE